MPRIPEASSIEAVRAAVEAIIPSVEGRPGAAELGVERHVVDSIEQYLPGFVDLLATLLDAYAADVRPGVGFVGLDVDERGHVFRAMSREESADLRDIIDGLLVFTYGGMYSEWTGYDRERRTLDRPAAWDDVDYHGPSEGHPDYREDV